MKSTSFRVVWTLLSLGFSSVVAHEESIVCRLYEVDVLYAQHRFGSERSPTYDCVDGNFESYTLDFTSSNVNDALVSGTQVVVTGRKDEASAQIKLTNSSGPSTSIALYKPSVHESLRRRHRQLTAAVQASGMSRVLVLRVNYRGAQPSLSASQLAGRVFGLGRERVGTDMAVQFDRCSFGKLRMKPFKGKGIVNGVAEIRVTQKVKGSNVKVLQNLWNIEGLRHILLVMPPGLLYNGSRYLAYAFLGSQFSVYNDDFAGQLSALMHELGHNLNLHHSGHGNDEYGDQSGYLGYGTRMVGGPNMCFNAQKYHTLGWFRDRSLSLDVKDLPWTGNIAPFVHYNLTAENEFVNLAIGGRLGNNRPLYLQYNLAESFNDGTQEFPNKITLTSAVEQFGALKSTNVGSMCANKNCRIRHDNFEATGDALIVKVCNRSIDNKSRVLVRICIHLDDGKQTDACDDSMIEPSMCENAPNGVKFFVDATKGRKNCQWLARKAQQSARWTDRLCVSNHLASHFCRATCGAC